jgi:hypothetical protein
MTRLDWWDETASPPGYLLFRLVWNALRTKAFQGYCIEEYLPNIEADNGNSGFLPLLRQIRLILPLAFQAMENQTKRWGGAKRTNFRYTGIRAKDSLSNSGRAH